MATTFEQIAKANETIKTTGIERYNKSKGKKEVKQYAEVPQRVKAFRMVYPGGGIRTELLQDTGERCTFRAEVYDEEGALLGSGTAFEDKKGTINTTSYIENCETSAVGRALAFAGFGIDTSISSAEELQAALAKQEEESEQKEAPKEKRTFDDAESLTKKTNREFQKPNADGTPTQYHKKDDPITTEQLTAIGKLQDTPERVEYYRKALEYWNVTPEKLTYSQGIEVIKKLRGIK